MKKSKLNLRCVLKTRELYPYASSNLPKTVDLAYQLDQETADEVANYLDRGYMVLIIMGYEDNPMSEDGSPLLETGIMTDGMWHWKREASYLIRNYRIGVPQDFIDWIRTNPQINHKALAKDDRLLEFFF